MLLQSSGLPHAGPQDKPIFRYCLKDERGNQQPLKKCETFTFIFFIFFQIPSKTRLKQKLIRVLKISKQQKKRNFLLNSNLKRINRPKTQKEANYSLKFVRKLPKNDWRSLYKPHSSFLNFQKGNPNTGGKGLLEFQSVMKRFQKPRQYRFAGIKFCFVNIRKTVEKRSVLLQYPKHRNCEPTLQEMVKNQEGGGQV